MINPLLNKGYQVVAYDAPAHGNSPGKSISLTEWADTILSALREVGNVSCIIGHSLGGGGIVLASSLQLNIDKIVLIAPLYDIIWVTERFADALSIPLTTIKKMRDYAWEKYKKSAEKYGSNWMDVFHSDFKIPTLIIHDKEDKEVAWEQSDALSKKWPWASFITTNGLGHRRIMQSKEVIHHITKFISS